MKIFDFNIHLPDQLIEPDGSCGWNETEITPGSILDNFQKTKARIKAPTDGAHFMLLNPLLAERPEDLKITIDAIRQEFPNSQFTLTLEFRKKDSIDHLDMAVEAGMNGLKFHSYIQRIEDSDFDSVFLLCAAASERKIPICFDASYGTHLLYRCDNLKLAAFIAEKITDTPIVLLHSGGRRVLDAMLIADSCRNIRLETSFSSNFYRESSVFQEMAFAYRKLGHHRIIYGSDFPYVAIEDAITDAKNLCNIAGFSDQQQDAVFWDNAQEIFGKKRGN